MLCLVVCISLVRLATTAGTLFGPATCLHVKIIQLSAYLKDTASNLPTICPNNPFRAERQAWKL